MRVTIAASGQGRWAEELSFPSDCKASGYTPILVVLDPTPNSKLTELTNKFSAEGGEAYVGADAWRHFDSLAGKTMSRFLKLYVHTPIQSLLAQMPPTAEELPAMQLMMSAEELTVFLLGETLKISRQPTAEETTEENELPDDVEEEFPGL